MIAAEPRSSANGEASMRPIRIGTSAGEPTLVRGDQHRDRIGAIRARCPDPVAAAGHRAASRASALEGERGATVRGQRLGRVEHR